MQCNHKGPYKREAAKVREDVMAEAEVRKEDENRDQKWGKEERKGEKI